MLTKGAIAFEATYVLFTGSSIPTGSVLTLIDANRTCFSWKFELKIRKGQICWHVEIIEQHLQWKKSMVLSQSTWWPSRAMVHHVHRTTDRLTVCHEFSASLVTGQSILTGKVGSITISKIVSFLIEVIHNPDTFFFFSSIQIYSIQAIFLQFFQ